MKSELKKELRSHCEELNYHFMSDKGSEVIKSVLNSKGFDDEQIEKAKTKALKYTEKETYQAMEALVHNLNSIKCVWHYIVIYSEKSYKLLKVPKAYVTTT